MTESNPLPRGVMKALTQAASKTKRRERPIPAERVPPTPEQMQGGRFVKDTVKLDSGLVLTTSYRRQPLFETLAKGHSGIDHDQLLALRFYRERHEATAASLTRCALDVEGRGGGSGQGLPPILDADTLVRRLEGAIGAVVDTMRAVALQDRSFSNVAITRFGSRKQTWLEMEKSRARRKGGGKMRFVEKVVPISGRHREIIRDEFMLGLKRLTQAHRLVTSTAPRARQQAVRDAVPIASPRAVQPSHGADHPLSAVDPAFLDEVGHMKPWDEVAQIIRDKWAA